MDINDLKCIIDNDNVVRDLLNEAFTRVVDNMRATIYKKAETIMYHKIIKEFNKYSPKHSVDNDFQTSRLTCAAVQRQPFTSYPSRSILVYYQSGHEDKLEKRRALAPNDTTVEGSADDKTFGECSPIYDEEYRRRQKADEFTNEKIVKFSKEIEDEFMRKLEARKYRLKACPETRETPSAHPNDTTTDASADDKTFDECRPIYDEENRRQQKADEFINEKSMKFSKEIEEEFMRKLEARKSRMEATYKRTTVDNEYRYDIETTHIESDENIKATTNDPIFDDESNLSVDDCSVNRTKDINYLLHQVNDTDTQLFKDIDLEKLKVTIGNNECRTAKYADVGMDCCQEADELDQADDINGRPEKKRRKKFRTVRKLCSRIFGRETRK